MVTIDGEHVHILAPEQKFFELMKTVNDRFEQNFCIKLIVKKVSFHIKSIVSCKQVKRHSPHFKLIALKPGSTSNTITYDFEAMSQQDAGMFQNYSSVPHLIYFLDANKPTYARA
jgi:hypothetical protein